MSQVFNLYYLVLKFWGAVNMTSEKCAKSSDYYYAVAFRLLIFPIHYNGIPGLSGVWKNFWQNKSEIDFFKREMKYHAKSSDSLCCKYFQWYRVLFLDLLPRIQILPIVCLSWLSSIYRFFIMSIALLAFEVFLFDGSKGRRKWEFHVSRLFGWASVA